MKTTSPKFYSIVLGTGSTTKSEPSITFPVSSSTITLALPHNVNAAPQASCSTPHHLPSNTSPRSTPFNTTVSRLLPLCSQYKLKCRRERLVRLESALRPPSLCPHLTTRWSLTLGNCCKPMCLEDHACGAQSCHRRQPREVIEAIVVLCVQDKSFNPRRIEQQACDGLPTTRMQKRDL